MTTSTMPVRTPEQAAELAALRKAAYAAYADHEHDMATNPAYKALADRQIARRDAAASKAGRTADFLGKPAKTPKKPALKQFSAYWSKDFHKSGTHRKSENFFTVENCYSVEDIEAINGLVVNQTWASHDYGQKHTVTRKS